MYSIVKKKYMTILATYTIRHFRYRMSRLMTT